MAEENALSGVADVREAVAVAASKIVGCGNDDENENDYDDVGVRAEVN